MSIGGDVEVHGAAASGYESLVDVFRANWEDYGEVGAAFALYVGGTEVVHVWGGAADRATGAPWQAETMAVTFSTTKGVAAIAVHHLAQGGRLDLDAPVAEYWPEFAQAGKERVTTRWILSHRAGLYAVEAPLSLDEVLAVRPVAEALAAQAPMWEPGTAHLYHPLSYGYLLGEIVLRVTGRTLGAYLREDVAGPLDADVWIGLPAAEEPRVATLIPGTEERGEDVAMVTQLMAERDTVGARAFLGSVFPPGFLGEGVDFNDRRVHASEIPAAGGIASARGLARLYGATVSEVDGRRILSPAVVDAARTVQSEGPPWGSDVAGLRLGMGFQLDSTARPMLTPGSFGHYGFGGSVGLADPDRGVAIGYVMNQLRGGATGDPRPVHLVREVERLTR